MKRKERILLNRINRRIPDELANNTVKEVVDISDEDTARSRLQDSRLSKHERQRLQRLIDVGAFRRSESEVNEEVVNQIDERTTRAVQQAIRRGELPDPMDDPFYRARVIRAQNLQPKPAYVLPPEEARRAAQIIKNIPTQNA